MSGGYFNYDQYKISQIIEAIDGLLFHNGSSGYHNYPPDIVEKFKIAVNKLEEAFVYTQRIDWLLSGDDGEESFRKRLKHDLEGLKLYGVEDE